MTDATSSDALMSPSFLSNRDPILSVLTRALPDRGTVPEIASGSGEHAVYLAAALPALIRQPTDPDQVARWSIAAHRAAARLPNLRPPLQLDASAASWPIVGADAVVAINMLHVSPWRAAEGPPAGAGRVLGPGGVLYLYGPYTASGNSGSLSSHPHRPTSVCVRIPVTTPRTNPSREHGGADLVDLRDHVGRNPGPFRGPANRFWARCLIEAVRLSLVGAQEGEDPLHALLIVDQLDPIVPFFAELDLLGEVSLDYETRHVILHLKAPQVLA